MFKDCMANADSATLAVSRTDCSRGEEPFWRGVGALWRQLAGSFPRDGFSFEWHEVQPANALNWGQSFHPSSIEICLNLQGSGWVTAGDRRVGFGPNSGAFFVVTGDGLGAERQSKEEHRFLSVEFSFTFLRQRLEAHSGHLHPLVARCLSAAPPAACSDVLPMTHRHRDLLTSLLHPPVLASAQRLWYETKALEFAAEFFFSAGDTEPLCTRAKRLAAERVARAKAVILENLTEPPSLEELGRKVGCSPFYLSRTFSQETGTTISQWLRHARLERAAELLRSGKFNVTEAALEVGYSSLSHFSQAFHEVFGCCPGLYPVRTVTQQDRAATPAKVR